MQVIYKQEFDRWMKGDRFIRPLIRKILRKKVHFSGMELVVKNFQIGLERKNISYNFNKYSFTIKKGEKIICFGLGENGLSGIGKNNPIIAAIGFPMPHEIPDLCERYNVKRYLQHSEWVLNLAKSAGLYPDSVFDTWSAGIDTIEWQDTGNLRKDIDVLIYNKLYWSDRDYNSELLLPITEYLKANGIIYEIVQYGKYLKNDYKKLLSRSSSLLFLSAHESQGFAYLEALASNVPVFAWNPGVWLDPVRFNYNRPLVPATSVPFFDVNCGDTFIDISEFYRNFPVFLEKTKQGEYSPRGYILDNLTIEKSTEKMLAIYDSI